MNIMTMKVRHAFVLIRRIKMPADTTGGIVVPGDAYGNYAMGEIVDVGTGNPAVSNDGTAATGYDFSTADLKEGMHVLFKSGRNANPLSGRPAEERTLPFKVNGEKLELLHEGDIIAIVTY